MTHLYHNKQVELLMKFQQTYGLLIKKVLIQFNNKGSLQLGIKEEKYFNIDKKYIQVMIR